MEFRTFFVLFILIGISESQLQSVFRNFGRLLNLNDGVIDDTTAFRKEYDFIIIGAGSGGSVVANRLSENPNWSILLLEAGEEEFFVTDIPLLAALQTATSYNWGYKSERLSTACLGLIEQRCNMPRGKALGGTSVINFLLYTRGNRNDFDEWARLGNDGWSYDEVLPYFVRMENCSLCDEIEREYHGFEGYLNVEHPHYEGPLVKAFIKAGMEMGYKNADPNGRDGLGFSKVQATMRGGRRCSASKAYLKPAKHRINLDISMKSRVTKILIEPARKEAFGVEFLKNKKLYRIFARKEVILSAGSINSPHLLMLSGIGPREELERVGIDVIQDLKVGFNLQDHMAMSTLSFLVNESVTVSDLRVQNPRDIFNYVLHGNGPYTIPGGAEALAFVKTKYARSVDDDYPDMELVLGAGALNGDVYGSLRNLLGIPQHVFDEVYAPWRNQPAFSIAPVLMRPKSRGRVRIKDANPLHWPILEPNYFEEEEDLARMVEGIKMAVELSSSRPFQPYSPILNPLPFPGCESLPFASDAYWACSVRHVATTLGHQVGTCKMGPTSDGEAVVDPQLRVYGIKNLRIVDGSIMPNIVAGHTNAVILMIGEKASELIKADWYNR